MSEYNGIGIAPLRSDLDEMIDAAVDLGSVIVTLDSDEPASKRRFFVGTNNLEAGAEAAHTLIDLVGENNPGTIVIYGNEFEDWIAGIERTQAAVDVLTAAGVIDDLKIAAFDFDLETIQFMEKGQIQATHTQRQYYMGLMVPYILYASVVLGIDETNDILGDIVTSDGIIDTGLDVVTTDNLAEYDAYLEQMGIAK